MKSTVNSLTPTSLINYPIQLLTSTVSQSGAMHRHLKTFRNTLFLQNSLINGWNCNLGSLSSVSSIHIWSNFRNGRPFLAPANNEDLLGSHLQTGAFKASARTSQSLLTGLNVKLGQRKSFTSGRSSSIFTHTPFLRLQPLFYQKALPLFHPYIPLNTEVFDWNGVNKTDFEVDDVLLDLHHKVVRRKVFLTVLNSLTKKIRVYSTATRYNFSYKDYASYNEGGDVVRSYTRIKPKQVSFLNNYEFKSEGWGLFLPSKTQVLASFFQAYAPQISSYTDTGVGRFDRTAYLRTDTSGVVFPFLQFFNKSPVTNLGFPGQNLLMTPQARVSLEEEELHYDHMTSRSQNCAAPTIFDRTLRLGQENFPLFHLRFTAPKRERLILKDQVRELLSSERRRNWAPKSFRLGVTGAAQLNLTHYSTSRGRPTSASQVSLLPTRGRHSYTSRKRLHGLYASQRVTLLRLQGSVNTRIKSRLRHSRKHKSVRFMRRVRRSLVHKLRGMGSTTVRGRLLPALFLRPMVGMHNLRAARSGWAVGVKTSCWSPVRSQSLISLFRLPMYRLLLARIVSYESRVKSLSVKGSFYKKSRILLNLQLSRARKYRRTRRTRRATALAVEQASDYLNDVQCINNQSQSLFQTYFKCFLLTKVAALPATRLARATHPLVKIFTAYNRREKGLKFIVRSVRNHYRPVANIFNLSNAWDFKSTTPLFLPGGVSEFAYPQLATTLGVSQPNQLLVASNFKVTDSLTNFTSSTLRSTLPGRASLTPCRLLVRPRTILVRYWTSPREATLPFSAFSSVLNLHPQGVYPQSESFTLVRPEIMSHYDTPFIFSNIGFLFISSTRPVLSEANNDQSLLRARFHKHRLSFFYKNELKRVFLKKPGLLRLISSFKEDDSLTNREFFTPTRWSVSSESPSHLSTSIASQFFHTSIEKERYLNQFEADLDAGEIEPDLALKRIRFKPGYQRIWRQAREALNYSMNFNYRYQVGLTKRLMWLRRARKVATWRLQELTLVKVLLNSHFVFDSSASTLLVQSNTVFINGTTSNNLNLKLFVGDFIQLIVTLRYYIVFRWLVNWNNYHHLRFKKLLNYRNNSSRTDLSKQVSRHLPDWIFTIGYRTLDIPNYLEVDYFTLSTFILYEPLSVTEFHPLTILEARPEIYTMYNWKYIT